MSINFNDHDLTTSGTITAVSGYFTTLNINNSNFNSSVSGLLPTIANSGDNRILTSTGSTVGINAESNLSFDGSLLNVTGSGNFASGLAISNQTASRVASFDANKNVVSLSTSTYPSLTELSYVKGVASSIQTQLNTHTHYTSQIYFNLGGEYYSLDGYLLNYFFYALHPEGESLSAARGAIEAAWDGITITAGSGLAGGGSLVANRTIHIGQGDGISVSADSIAVDSTVVRTTGVQTISGAKTFTAATVFSTGVTISSSGTNVPLTITHDGTGNCFVVNDVTGDTSPFVIDSSGNVGIGTSSPTLPLSVFSSATSNSEKATLLLDGTVGTSQSFAGIRFKHNIYTTGWGADILAIDVPSFNASLVFRTTSGGANTSTPIERMRITSDGNVGIGTSSPSSHLHVLNTTTSEEQVIIAEVSGGFSNGAGISFRRSNVEMGRINADYFDGMTIFVTSGSNSAATEKIRITASNNIDFKLNSGSISHRFNYNENGGEIILHDDAQNNATLIDQCNNETRVLELIDGSNMVVGLGGSNTTGAIRFMRAGFQEAMRIDSSGNVGIGTNSPSFANPNGGIVISNANAPGLRILSQASAACDLEIYGGTIASHIRQRANIPLVFWTNDTERLRIDASGNVGIGTNSVSSGFKVDIRGRILSYTTASDGLITTQGLQTTSGGTGKAAIQIDVNGKGGFAWQNDASSGTRSLKLIENSGYGAGDSTLLTVQSGGNTGLGASPSNDYKLVIGGGTRTDSYTTNPSLVAIKDFTNTNTGDNLSSATYSYATTNGNYAIRNVAINTYFKINSGITNSGSSIGIANNNLRNYALTNDIGTLSTLYGIYNQYGHYNTSAVSPVTTTAIGIQHILWRAAGTITNAFDIYCSDASSGATVTNRWGIYVEHTGKNYFGGNTGIGVSPTYRFEVRGSGATSSTVSFYISNSSGAALLYTRDDGAINTGTAAVSPYNNTTATAANMVVGSDGFLYRSTSSLRYKTDVNDATHGLNEVLQLKSVIFKSYNDGNKIFGGLIAEEVDKIGLTEFVQYDNENRPDSIHYGNMVALLIKAIQDQQIIINNLKDRLSILEGN
jgi:hypothetical protein